jgi:hypothetical protein
MICLPRNAAIRRYTYRFPMVMALYVVFLFFAVWTFKHHPPTGVLAWLLAILPSLPIIASLGVIGLYLTEEKDEFQRTVLVQSMLWSIGGTLVVTTVWGFLENFLHVIHFDLYLVFPLFWLFVGITTPILKARYK